MPGWDFVNCSQQFTVNWKYFPWEKETKAFCWNKHEFVERLFLILIVYLDTNSNMQDLTKSLGKYHQALVFEKDILSV